MAGTTQADVTMDRCLVAVWSMGQGLTLCWPFGVCSVRAVAKPPAGSAEAKGKKKASVDQVRMGNRMCFQPTCIMGIFLMTVVVPVLAQAQAAATSSAAASGIMGHHHQQQQQQQQQKATGLEKPSTSSHQSFKVSVSPTRL